MLLIDRNVRWLESKQVTEADRKGAWSYPGPGGDNSNSQFAVLALYDAQSVGAKVKRQTWQLAADYWRNTQNEDGSWGYVPGDAGIGQHDLRGNRRRLPSSTAALESGDAAVERGRVVCCRPHATKTSLERAIDWLAEAFFRQPQSAAGRRRPGVPLLLSLRPGARPAGSRPGASSATTIGTAKAPSIWSSDQDPLSHYWQGTWHAERRSAHQHGMSLLFLSKGSPARSSWRSSNTASRQHWNQHRRDAAHLVAYTEEDMESRPHLASQ